MYSPSSRTPKWSAPGGVWPPADSVPTGSPTTTASPTVTSGETGSRVVTSPPPWSIVTTPRPATGPANAITPAAGDEITRAGSDGAISTPRWPGPYSCAGATKASTMRNGCTGHLQPARVSGSSSTARAGPPKATTTTRLNSAAAASARMPRRADVEAGRTSMALSSRPVTGARTPTDEPVEGSDGPPRGEGLRLV